MALNNVPLAGQSLAVTRVPINANFATIDAAFLVDHVDYNVAGQGKHNQVTLPVQAASPGTLATEIAVFSRLSTLTAINEFCMRRQANGSVIEMTSSLNSPTGWTFLPSGILLKWGAAASAGGATVFTYPVAATNPVFNQVFVVLLQPETAATAFVTAHGVANFNYTASGAGTFQYLALGF